MMLTRNSDPDTENYNKIIRWLQNPIEANKLPVTLETLLKRIDDADNLLRRYPRNKVAKMLMTKYEIQAKSNAYKIINAAMYVYNSQNIIQKEYWRNLLVDKTYAELLKYQEQGNDRGFNNAMKNLITLIGLDKDESKITAEMLQQHNIVFNINIGEGNSYMISAEKLSKLSGKDKENIVSAIEAESIGFDMVEFIEEEENKALSENASSI